MKKWKVISKKNLPVHPPVWKSVFYVMAMDYWNAPEWLLGVGGVYIVTMWVVFIFAKKAQIQINLFDDSEEIEESKKSNFRERLDAAIEEQRKKRCQENTDHKE